MRRAWAPPLAVLASVLVSSCAVLPPALLPRPSAVRDLVEVPTPPIEDDLADPALASAIGETVRYLDRLSAGSEIRVGSIACSAASLRSALSEIGPSPGRRRWRALRSPRALVTGYYEPVLDARRTRSGAYVHPLYRRPDDLVELAEAAAGTGEHALGRMENGRLVPYYSRRDIDAGGALAGRGLELGWLDDPVARFFLHVQGSGVLRFEDGTRVRLGFAASNGRPYTSIGRLLVDRGALAPGDASAPGIQRWLRTHPAEASEVLLANERYVFFEPVADGPVGAAGVRLTAGRSIAVDRALYPLGALAYLVSSAPVVDAAGRVVGSRPIHRLVLAQDAGAAIVGPGRVDLFFGGGKRAGLEAGTMHAGGDLYFLMPEC